MSLQHHKGSLTHQSLNTKSHLVFEVHWKETNYYPYPSQSRPTRNINHPTSGGFKNKVLLNHLRGLRNYYPACTWGKNKSGCLSWSFSSQTRFLIYGSLVTTQVHFLHCEINAITGRLTNHVHLKSGPIVLHKHLNVALVILLEVEITVLFHSKMCRPTGGNTNTLRAPPKEPTHNIVQAHKLCWHNIIRNWEISQHGGNSKDPPIDKSRKVPTSWF